jgi:hypothetical protein
MPRYGARKANGGQAALDGTVPARCFATGAERNSGRRRGEGSGVLAPNPSFLVNKTRFLHANRKSTSLENALEHQPACKPGFVGHRLLARTIRDGHSSGTMFAHCLKQPTRTASLTSPCGVIAHRANVSALPSLFGLAPGVVCHAVSVAGPAVRSYRTLSPLLRQSPEGAKASGSFSVALSLGSPPPDVIRHRMSMEPGLSSPATFR